jgi:hypothetical protein
MFLKLKEFGGILFYPEESVSLSIVRVGPYLVALVCIPPFIYYLFQFSGFFILIYFSSRCSLFLSGMMDYIVICFFGLILA